MESTRHLKPGKDFSSINVFFFSSQSFFKRSYSAHLRCMSTKVFRQKTLVFWNFSFRLKPDFHWRISISIGINTSTCVSKCEHRRHKHKHRKNGQARSSCAYAYAVAVTSENGVGISTRYRLRHRVEENWYRELSQICHSARAYDLMLNMLVLIAYALVKTRLI